jgi:hypothetical protein
MPRRIIAGKTARPSLPPNFKMPKKTPPSSNTNTSASNDDNSPQTAEPPSKKRMTLEEAPLPVAQEKQPEPVEKQPMNVVVQMQGIGNKINITELPIDLAIFFSMVYIYTDGK